MTGAKDEIQKAQEVLANAGNNKKGFRKPSKKEIKKAQEVIQKDRKERADAFLQEYAEKDVCPECKHERQGLIKRHGIEITATAEPLQGQPNVFKAALNLGDYHEPKQPQTKKWSEAMGENLDLRKNCTHQIDEEEIKCEKCGLPPANWGAQGIGVTKEFEEKTIQKIKDQQQKELEEEKEEQGDTNT